ncbi:MAG: hypothetical protein IPP47_23165 [Bryobacterales bacterium]|nr:hypothetical protein [Bryobacterales bacterium]
MIRYVTYSLPRGTGASLLGFPGFVLSESVEGVANYNNGGLFAILVHGSVADGSPMLSLSLNELNLIGFGAVRSHSQRPNRYSSLQPERQPTHRRCAEPSPRSTVALAGLLGAMIEWRRRTSKSGISQHGEGHTDRRVVGAWVRASLHFASASFDFPVCSNTDTSLLNRGAVNRNLAVLVDVR